MKLFICKNCGSKFKSYPRTTAGRRRKNRFCSKKCAYLYRRSVKEVTCGHDKPYCANGLCKSCYLKTQYRKHRTARLEAVRAYSKKYRNRKENREKERDARYRRKYGISLEDYNRMAENQKGLCAICGREQTEKKRLQVDHNHQTNKVRGLLCSICNRIILGILEHFRNSVTLPAIIKYLTLTDPENVLLKGELPSR